MGKTLGYGEITVANMTEPFTVMLTNEAQQFATDSNRKVTSAQSYYTDIIVIRGSQERTDYTIGNITSGSGITVSKNSKRVTFSVSAGTTIGADAGVIEIPITLDGQTVKKQFSWSCGKQGPQGVKGDPGTSVKITSKSVTYQTSTSGTTAPTGTWSTTVPTVNNGQYLWTKTTVQYSDGNKTEAYSVSYKGTNGTNGTSVTVSKTEVTYQVSTSGTTAPTGTWSTTMPSCDQGQYLWTKTYVKYSDGKETTSYSVSYKGVDGEKFSWNLFTCSTLTDGDQENKANWRRGFINNSTHIGYTNDGFHFTTNEQGSKDSNGISFNISRDKSGLHVGDTVTFSVDIKGTIGTGNPQMQYWGSTKTDSSDWATRVFGDSLKTVKKDSYTRYSVTAILGDLYSSKSNDLFCVGGGFDADLYIKNIKLEKCSTATPWAPHPEDLEGRGVSQTVQYYLATSQASGVTSSTSGWSTDITTQKLTADKKYLWNCYQTKYSDGTSEPISTPKVIGVYGDKGQKGENAKNLSITPSSQYFKSTDGGKTFAPNTITIKPTIQGEINFGKWQYSIDGGVSFADAVSGQKGLTISNNVLAVSKDSSLYSDAVTMVTFRAVASDSSFYDTCSIAKIYDVSDIGDGRNLLTGVSSYTKDTPFEKTDSRADGWIVYQNIITSIELEAGKKYVLQAKTDGNWTANHDTNGQDPSKKLVALWLCSDTTNDFFDMRQGYAVFTPAVTAKYKLRVNQYSNGTDAYTIHLWDIKLEKGSSPTGWTPAPEDLQTAILSTKSEISDVSLKVDNNKQAIEQRVEKTTYQQDLNLVKGDISKANEGLNKWRYEIYPKSLFTDKPEDQRKISLDVFARNKNIIPTQSILLDDTKLGYFNYDDNYIGYAVTFVKMSEATKLETTFVHDDAGSFYLNGKLICTNGTNNFYSSATPDTVSCTLVKGWNCLEVVINEGAGSEGFKFGTVLSQLSTCQLMNCYYAMVTGRESQITNTLVQNTIDIEGVSTKVGKVTSIIGENGENFTDFKNDYSDFKQTMNGFKATVGQTYVTKDDFNGLEIGGRNLILNSAFKKGRKEWSDWGNPTTREIVSSNGKSWAHIVGNQQNYQGFNQWTPAGSIKEGDHITFSARIKGSAANQRFSVGIHWLNSGNTIINQDWHVFTVDTTENIYTWTVDAKGSGCDKLNLMVGVSDTSAAYNVYFTEIMVVKGNKSSDWTPALEDNEINGQNLVSNLSSNWEQGSVSYVANSTYASIKTVLATRLRTEDVFSVSGNVTISAGTSTNSSKEELNFYYVLFDVNKKAIGVPASGSEWQSLTSPKIINCGDAKYMAIILRWGSGSTAITPSDISQICLKIERGTSATPFTLAPEDVNGKIVNVETIANQTAKKFEWIVKGGDSSSNFTLTDRVADLVAERINFNGLVKFSGLNTDAKNEIGKVAQSKVDGLEVGGRNLLVQKNITQGYLATDGKGSFINSGGGDQTSDWIDVSGNKYITITLYEDFTNTNNSGRYCEYDADKNCISTIDYNPRQKSSVIIELKSNTKYIRVTAIECKTRRYKIEAGNKATDWTPAPEDVSQDATNKASQALTDAKNYSSSAVNWVTNNGSSTTSLNSMVKKWTDGAVSDTTQINGGWIKANTITASKIAVGDFTNYADINESNTYGFSVEKTTDGVWFSKDGSKLTRDNYISKMYSCEPGQTFYVEYDISNTIKDSTEYKAAGIMLFGCDGTQTVKWYQRRGAVVGTAAGTVTHMSQQLTMPSGTRFFYVVLQIEGFQPFTGTLKIRNLSVRKAVTGAVIVDGSITADKIATDAIKSRNYISSGGTQGSFLNLSDGSFTSPNLSWDANGNLIAKNANISGQITATKGSIAGWTIISDKMYTTGSGKYTGIGKYGSAYAFWAGATSNDNGNSAVFKVSHTGKLTATDADITGTITATNGKIGRYDITSTYLMTNSGSNASGIGGNQAFWAGAEDSNSAPFRVGYDGVLWAENAAIRGSIETGNLGDEGDTVVIMNGRIGIQGTSNNVEIYSTGFKFGIDGDYYLESVSEGVKCYRNLYATDFIADGWIYNASGGHYTWKDRDDAYISCGDYNGHNVYYYANYHAFYVNKDSGQGMMYINTDGVTSRVGFTKTSDERIKKNFESFDDNIIDAYMNIEPVKYQLKQSSNDKYHFGFKAQHIDKVFSDYGDIYNESFDICTSRPIDPDKAKELYGVDGMVEEYGLRYDELIAPTTYMVQHTYKELESTKDELTKVKQEKADLETRLQAIEAKLGL